MVQLATVVLALCTVMTALEGAESRSSLLFDFKTALKTHDRPSAERCFNLQGLDEATRQSMGFLITQLMTWTDPIVSTTERQGTGPLDYRKDGGAFTLNGDWQYQVAILRSANQGGGFVFPAGTVDGKSLILCIVPAH